MPKCQARIPVSLFSEISLDSEGNIAAMTREHKTGVVADENGLAVNYSFEVPDGEYTLVIKKPGYAKEEVNVTVVDGKADIGDIILRGNRRPFLIPDLSIRIRKLRYLSQKCARMVPFILRKLQRASRCTMGFGLMYFPLIW